MKAFDVALKIAAGALAVSLLLSALHDVSQAFDVWYYHLPFAALLTGIVDGDSYAFSADNQARFEGFPLFGELLQGCLWRITGLVQATNLVAYGALVGLPLHLRRRFGVPAHLALLSLLAIPLVQIHATSAYVDLPGNVFATLLLLDVWRAFVADEPPTPRDLAWSGIFAAAAVNMKFQLVPIVVVASLALAARSLDDLRRWRTTNRAARSALARRAAVLALAIPTVFATPIKNVVVHGNPVWPVALRLAGHELPHVEEAYDSSPRHLERAPRPVRFLRSVFEVDNRPITTKERWSVDQWTPPDDPGLRMGGFFGAYVALNLVAFGAALRKRSRETVAAAIVFGVATVVAATVPQSHELRYYLFWMLLLVSQNLVLWARRIPWAVGAAAAAAVAVVAWSTDAGYLYPSGMTFDELLRKRVDAALLSSAGPGERICVARQPFTFLYAPRFHGRSDYTVQEMADPSDCAPPNKP